MNDRPGTRLMNSPMAALVWEQWRRNRGGYLLLTAAIVFCAVVYRLNAALIAGSEFIRFLCFQPFVISLAVVFGLIHFTETDPKGGQSGFPARLFSLPVRTSLLVGCP